MFVVEIDSGGESLGRSDGPEVRVGIWLGLELGEVERECGTLPVIAGSAVKDAFLFVGSVGCM